MGLSSRTIPAHLLPRGFKRPAKRQGENGVAVSIELPIRTVSEANCRDHWAVKARRVKSQRGWVFASLYSRPCLRNLPGATITLTRVRTKRARRLDDDNLRSSLKAVRDGVADALGIDDGDGRLQWVYQQDVAEDYAVRVEVKGKQ